MKVTLFLLLISVSASSYARTVRLRHTGSCYSQIERNTFGSLTQKSKLRSCARQSSLEGLYQKCESRGGYLSSYEKIENGSCSSIDQWGGRLMSCNAQVEGFCEIY